MALWRSILSEPECEIPCDLSAFDESGWFQGRGHKKPERNFAARKCPEFAKKIRKGLRVVGICGLLTPESAGIA